MSLKNLLSNYYGGVRGDVSGLAPYKQWKSLQHPGSSRYELSLKWKQDKEAFTRNYYENMGIAPPGRAQPVPRAIVPRARVPRVRGQKKPKKRDFVAQLISEGAPKSIINAQWKAMYPPKPRRVRADLDNYTAYKQNRQTNCIIKNDPQVILARKHLQDVMAVAKARKSSNMCRKYRSTDNWIVNHGVQYEPPDIELD